MSANYEKAWWLAWSTELYNYNMNHLGNVIESIIGIWEAAVQHRHYFAEDEVVMSVAQNLSKFVRLVYCFTEYTDTLRTPCEAWAQCVTKLAQPGRHKIFWEVD